MYLVLLHKDKYSSKFIQISLNATDTLVLKYDHGLPHPLHTLPSESHNGVLQSAEDPLIRKGYHLLRSPQILASRHHDICCGSKAVWCAGGKPPASTLSCLLDAEPKQIPNIVQQLLTPFAAPFLIPQQQAGSRSQVKSVLVDPFVYGDWTSRKRNGQ